MQKNCIFDVDAKQKGSTHLLLVCVFVVRKIRPIAVVGNACGFSHCHRWGPVPEAVFGLETVTTSHAGRYVLITQKYLSHRSKSTAMYETKASSTRLTHRFCLQLFVCITDLTSSLMLFLTWEYLLPMDYALLQLQVPPKSFELAFFVGTTHHRCGWHVWLLWLKKFTLQAFQHLKLTENAAPFLGKKVQVAKDLTWRNVACGHSRPKHVLTIWCCLLNYIESASLEETVI